MMKAGTYYVGDLCYVLDEVWDEFCSITIDGNNCLNGEFTLKDGTKFATYSTAWGDGCYLDQFRRQYGVDAGLIGCVSLEDLKKYNVFPTKEHGCGGNVIEFQEDFETSGTRKEGIIRFGDIVIDTNGTGWDSFVDEDDEDSWV